MLRPAYARVRKRAAELLVQQAGPPADLATIADALGVEIRHMALEADVSGVLYREAGRRVIVVNGTHSHERQRFTIAHEIGHLVLHAGEPVHVDGSFRVFLRDRRSSTAEEVEEIEANAFAANLLMPADWLLDDVGVGRVDPSDEATLRDLASRYGVSLHAMALRLGSLNLD